MLWHILGSYLLLIWGVGVVEIVFSSHRGSVNMQMFTTGCSMQIWRSDHPKLPRYLLSISQNDFLKEEKLKGSDILFPCRIPSPRPRPDPTQHPRNGPETDPERTRNGAKRSRNGAERSQTEPKWTEIKPSRVGRPGGLSGWGGVGVVREKEYHY